MNARTLGGAAGLHGLDNHAFRFRHSQTRSDDESYPSNPNPELAAANLAALHQLIHNRSGHIGRNRETDSYVSPAHAWQNLRIDPDQLTDGIHERATRVALIDGRIGLQ